MTITTLSSIRPQLNRRALSLLALAALFLLLTRAYYVYVPDSEGFSAIDWKQHFYPAAQAFWNGEDPYDGLGFYNPPWVLWLQAPLGLLSLKASAAVFCVCGFFAYAYAARRLGASLTAAIAIAISFGVANNNFKLVNNDWLVALGLVMPPQIGLFFVLAKPQMGIGVALFWLVEAWRKAGWRETVRVFGPVVCVFLFSILVHGFWFRMYLTPVNASWNMSLFPFMVPLGAYLMLRALRRRDLLCAIPVGVLLSPYVAMGSWSIVLLALIKRQKLVIATSALTWLAIPVLYFLYVLLF